MLMASPGINNFPDCHKHLLSGLAGWQAREVPFSVLFAGQPSHFDLGAGRGGLSAVASPHRTPESRASVASAPKPRGLALLANCPDTRNAWFVHRLSPHPSLKALPAIHLVFSHTKPLALTRVSSPPTSGQLVRGVNTFHQVAHHGRACLSADFNPPGPSREGHP